MDGWMDELHIYRESAKINPDEQQEWLQTKLCRDQTNCKRRPGLYMQKVVRLGVCKHLGQGECKAGRFWKSRIYLYNKGWYHTHRPDVEETVRLQLWHHDVDLSQSEMFPWGDSAKAELKHLRCSLCLLLQEPSLYTVKAVFILDNDGNRLLSKVRFNDGARWSYNKLSDCVFPKWCCTADFPKYGNQKFHLRQKKKRNGL